MSRKKGSHSGKCHLCGKQCNNLTFEHIPPHAAFNNNRVKMCSSLDVLANSELRIQYENPFKYKNLKAKTLQQGSGLYCLCKDCNNRTGDWYAKEYVRFVKKIIGSLQNGIKIIDGKATITVSNVYPLRILKQILVMFCDINGYGFGNEHLRHFLLTKEDCSFSLKSYDCSLYGYFLGGTCSKLLPTNQLIVKTTSGITIIPKTSYAKSPLGIDMYMKSVPGFPSFDTDLTDLLSGYTYTDKTDLTLTLPYTDKISYI